MDLAKRDEPGAGAVETEASEAQETKETLAMKITEKAIVQTMCGRERVVWFGPSRGNRARMTPWIAAHYGVAQSRVEFIECAESEVGTEQARRGRWSDLILASFGQLSEDERLSLVDAMWG